MPPPAGDASPAATSGGGGGGGGGRVRVASEAPLGTARIHAALFDSVRSLRSTYWFVPAWMAVAAVAASLLTLWIDAEVGSEVFADHLWAYTNRPDGARAVLSTIAGSMITVAGVTFSMTIASVSYAAGQLGPRLMTNFMRDRGNQYTLGTFIATFLYALMILRTVRGGSDDNADFAVSSFVPQVSVLVALGLAIASTAVLIYFIHHVPESINAQNITAGIGRDLLEGVEERFPGRIGEGRPEEPAPEAGERDRLPAAFGEQGRLVGSPRSGYIRAIDDERLMKLCREHGLVVELLRRPGDFVAEGQPVLKAWPPERFGPGGGPAPESADAEARPVARIRGVFGGEAEPDPLTGRLQGLLSLGSEKTHHQDLRFLVDELVEIAARAVSPGINDPFTAVTAIDWLRSGLAALGEREPLEPRRLDEDGVLRVLAVSISFEEALGLACDQLRPYVAADRNAALHLMNAFGDLALSVRGAGRRERVLAEAEALADATDGALPLAIDRALLRERLMTLQAAAGSLPAASA
ncbi:DUF2254 domain-containing protein [Phycisphaera mikurensis]|uniref:Cyclic nucleotide-binding domain-containing protein n=1 Tax=Phycisphaera mikurensis (strain NBRC 102666 / KCTC 22515 / FYK2301M01) TaxID=1142394 RepID=I0IEL1_PHYMF|nr:DUF2254 domain-containing protein [Phycisphaera mikurensis]MBB6441498.1 putative membrane protein [Phycisphaera mikurensis]BAM03699.1 hypothetical protein PSMK_15400 [Phycisphaera mikurensis NBRC 102666]